jgi:hypothetical protein
MTREFRAAAILCFFMLLVFGFSFWIGAQKPPAEGGMSLTSH